MDGKQVQFEAYAINGNNYIKLRDVGKAVDFEVYWDGQAVQIERGKPYTGVAPTTQLGQRDGYLTNGKPITEENVQDLLRQIELESPDALRSFQVTDGNNGSAVWWPDDMSRYSKTLLDWFGPDKDYRLEAWTRYPEGVPFTGNSAGTWITEYKN